MSALTTHSDTALSHTAHTALSDANLASDAGSAARAMPGTAHLGPTPRSLRAVGRVAPTPIPTGHHARARLHEVEQMLLAMWTSALPDLDSMRSAHLCAAHRAVHEAMLLLDEGSGVVADTGPFPGER